MGEHRRGLESAQSLVDEAQRALRYGVGQGFTEAVHVREEPERFFRVFSGNEKVYKKKKALEFWRRE